MKRCECCGQIIPPTVTALDNMRVKKRIYDCIAKNPQGIGRDEIMDKVYGDDPDGGPEFVNVISVHVLRINKLLKAEGVKIHSTRGPHATYRLVAL